MNKLLTFIAMLLFLNTYPARGQEISADFSFKSNYIKVFDSNMHYVDEYKDNTNPEQLTFLFLHGNPTSSYLWRNIIPYVKDHGRALAPDLIGMGKSDKPALDYTFQDHSRYLKEFIRLMDLKNVVLVVHDWGSALGFHYAARYEEKIKGIVFMEALTRPMQWKEANMMERMLFKRMRKEEKGHKMIAENNFFIKTILFKIGTKRKLTEREKEFYAAPYPTVESRKPIKVWPQEIPIEGNPERNFTIVNEYARWLRSTETPMLMLYASPGMIIKKKEVERMRRELKNLKQVHVGKGMHYIQEDHPHEIGRAIDLWAEKL